MGAVFFTVPYIVKRIKMSYTPKFEINDNITALVNDIQDLSKKAYELSELNKNPTLRRKNRIRTIRASLAIEQNTLTVEQVTAVLNGKAVIAPPKDIAEVKNAYEIYELLDTLNPYSVDDLLKAHGVMTRGLVEQSGEFRSKPVGVYDSESGEIIHIGTLPNYVAQTVENLLEWCKSSNINEIIKSCVFHFEFEAIHPFLDGNGRMGRLWQTLILSKYNPLFAYLPIESMIHNRQEEYYNALNISDYEGNSTQFIQFMLTAIRDTLIEALSIQQ